MNKRFVIRLLIVAFGFTVMIGCTNSTEKLPSKAVLEINPEILDISSFTKYINKIRFIPLESKPNAVIGGISKVVSFGERYYVFDHQFSKSINIYSKKGQLINNIHSPGKGPGEFVNLADMAVDPFNNELVICDSSGKKIVIFDLDGNFLSELKLNFFPQSIGFVDSMIYAFKTMDEGTPVVVTTDHNGNKRKIVHSGIFEFNLTFSCHFTRYKDHQFFSEHLNDTIYILKDGHSEPWLYLDFMDLKITKSYQNELIVWARKTKRMPRAPKSRASGTMHYLETEEVISFGCAHKGKASRVFLNRNSKQQLMLKRNSRGSDPMTKLIFGIRTTNDSGQFICYVRTDTYLDLLENKDFMELAKSGITYTEDQGFKDQKDVSLDSNPLLAIIEFNFPKY